MGLGETTPRVLRFGVFELDRSSGELRRDGLRVRLQEQPLRILEALLDARGEPVTREALRQRLWPDETFVDFDNGLNRAVSRLRAALGDEGRQPALHRDAGAAGVPVHRPGGRAGAGPEVSIPPIPRRRRAIWLGWPFPPPR